MKCKAGELAFVTRVDLGGCTCGTCQAVKQQLISQVVKVVSVMEDGIWNIEKHIPVTVPFIFGLTQTITLHALPDNWLTPIRGEPEGERTDTPIGHRIPDVVH